MGVFLFLLCVFLFHPQKLFSEDLKKPYVSIFYENRYITGVVEFSSIEDPQIQVSSTNISGSAKLEIYQATSDDLLRYLIHDDKYQQINPQVDTSKLSRLSDLEVQLSNTVGDISLPISQNGIFFLRLKMGDLESQTFVTRSTFGTLARETKDSLILWSQDFSTKRSLSEGKATLYNLQYQKKIIGTANLDADAVASLPLSQDADIAVVESNGSVSFVPLNARYLNGDYSWLTFRENQLQKRYFIFTDRPIYKPGDTVRFKAIVRNDDDARYSLPVGVVKVEVSQGYDRKIFLLKDSLSIDPNGFVSSAFTIPKTAKTGDYRISLNPDTTVDDWTDDSGSGNTIFFKVENYRKPEYLINAESPQIDVVRGDKVDVKITGEYYSGQPLSGVVVDYKIRSTDYGYYESDNYYPDNGNHYYRSWYGTDVGSGTVTLDSKGKANITFPTDKNDSLGKHQVYFIEFIYKDATGNPSTTGVNVLVRSGEYSLYRDGYGPYGGKPNDKISFPFLLKTNSAGLSLSQKVDVSIVRNWWEKVQKPDAKYPTYNPTVDAIGKYSFTTDASGRSVFDFTPTLAGNYELNTEITDSRGNKINKTFYLWISDQYSYSANSGDTSSVRLTTDKKTYRSGDTALVNFVSEIPDRDVFFAFERGYQDRYQIVHLTGQEKTVEVKIFDHDAPNTYLVAKTFDNANLAGDVQNISVDTTGKKVFFTLSTDKKNYAPGDDVTVNIKAADVSGNPLETNFALWSVDKAIFALTDKNYGDIFDRFWNDRYDNTAEANSLEGIMVIGGAEKGGCFLPGTKIIMANGFEKSIEDVKVGDEVLTRLSDTSGKLVKTPVTAVHATIAPDYLIINQTLRVTANHLLYINQHWRPAGLIQIGDDLTDNQGSQIKVVSLERLFNQTNVYNLTTAKYHTYFANGYYVHNQKGNSPRDNFADTAYWNVSVNTNSQGLAQIKFKLPDNLTTWVITALGATTDTRVGEAFTEIKVNKDLVIRPALPNILGEGDLITVTALVNNFTDIGSHTLVSLKTTAGQIISSKDQAVDVGPNDFSSVSWQIKVKDGGVANFEFSVKDDKNRSDTVVQNLDIRSSGYWQQSSVFKIGSNTFDLSLPDQAFDSQKTDIKLSLSSSILGSLPSAMTYLINYPYGCTEQTVSGLLPKIIAKKYPEVFSAALKQQSAKVTIDDGIIKLTNLQNGDGGWPWWHGSSDSFVTAYVYRLLNIARSVGVKIDDSLFANAENYLLNNYEKDPLETKVAKAYGLAFSPNSKLYKTISETDLAILDVDHLAMAVSANITAGLTESSKNGLDLLLSRAQSTVNGLYWTAGKGERFGSVESSTALAIQALIRSNSHLPEAAKAINYLLQTRHFDYWASTYATAQTILAVTDFSQLQKESQTNLSYTVSLDGKILSSGKLVGLQTTPIEIGISPIKIGKIGGLTITTQGNGQLYSTLTQKWWIKDPNGSKSSNGVAITKKIVNHKGDQYNLVPGDLVDVILNITFDPNTTNPNGYALIEDHLPAGLIPVNTRLNNESEDTNSYSYYDYSREYLLDGIIIPVYYGDYSKTYTYQARVISAGTFNIPPAYFGQMYYPEVWARSDSATLTVDTSVKTSPLVKLKNTFPKIGVQADSVVRYIIIPVIFLSVFGLIIFLAKSHVKRKSHH